VFLLGSILGDAGTFFGTTAAAIAVCGFAAHLKPALSGEGDEKLREATLAGGIAGMLISLGIVVLSAVIDKVHG
jgi:hypothetical protein